MKISKIELITSAVEPKGYPRISGSEIAVAGRSNVGKSSLLNMILGRKTLVRTGSRPGLTRTINFFRVNESFTLADLPGLGYAQADVSVRHQLKKIVLTYIEQRENLGCLLLLVDSRREAGEVEFELLEKASARNIPVAVVMTKVDKLNTNELARQRKLTAGLFGIHQDDIFICSSLKKTGRKELLSLISDIQRGCALTRQQQESQSQS